MSQDSTAAPTPAGSVEDETGTPPPRQHPPRLPPLPWAPSPFHPIRRLLLETTQDLLQRRRR
jgi:hypothetical protein